MWGYRGDHKLVEKIYYKNIIKMEIYTSIFNPGFIILGRMNIQLPPTQIRTLLS